jgi:type IV fimbrial biogenesis protein FimT
LLPQNVAPLVGDEALQLTSTSVYAGEVMSAAAPLFDRGPSLFAGRGFGLIELLVTIAILAILTALALPSYRTTLQNNRGVTQADDLLNAINDARGEAITRSRFVSICAANTGGTACSGDVNWANGWIVFEDDYVNTGVVDGTDVILRAWPAIDPQDSITTTATYISFDRYGKPRTNGGGTTASFTLKPLACTAGANLQRVLSVASLGRASVVRGDCT